MYLSKNKYIQKKTVTYKPRSINLEVYNIACQIILKKYQETPSGPVSHEKIVSDAYAEAEKLFASGIMADRLDSNGSKISQISSSTEYPSLPTITLDSPTSSGYVSEEDIPSSGTTSGYSSGTDSGVSSGSVSPSPPLESTKKLSIGTPGVDFVFNIGAANATSSCQRTLKVDLGDGSFEMIVDPNTDNHVPKKIKVFTPEELEKQAAIVAEFRRNILGST